MSGWWVPGLAIGIVEDGKPVFRKTFGMRDTETRAPVTANTLFGIGSVAKSMTALSFAISDAQNDLSLDSPVKSILPYFPARITLRHLLSHTAGWPRHDALWYLDAYNRHMLPRKLTRLSRFAAPGKSFQYNNVPFAAVGEFMTEFAGVPWDYWIRATVLDPAGMSDAVTGTAAFRNTKQRAAGYYPAADGRISIPLRDTDPVAPAGGVYAHLNDMIRYVQLLANAGRRDGEQVVPAAAVRRLWQPTTPRYGLGMQIGSWRGEKLAFHPGAIDGYAARISILPARRAGVIVLSNLSGETRVAQIVSQIALDCVVGAPPTDWLARLGPLRPDPEEKPEPPPVTNTDRNREAYTGAYQHPAYGPFLFDAPRENHTLTGTFHDRDIVLDYTGDDTWRLRETNWPLREGLPFRFQNLENGKFQTLATPLADGPSYRHNAGPLTFERIHLP
ncbi:MAG: serine hydrolase domain-containing protein [Alphaproteobacteria bacterium]